MDFFREILIAVLRQLRTAYFEILSEVSCGTGNVFFKVFPGKSSCKTCARQQFLDFSDNTWVGVKLDQPTNLVVRGIATSILRGKTYVLAL